MVAYNRSMLKLGAIVSGLVFAVGLVALLLLSQKGVISTVG